MLNTSCSIANPVRQVAANSGMVCNTIGAPCPLVYLYSHPIPC
jgi:hypothetical protein